MTPEAFETYLASRLGDHLDGLRRMVQINSFTPNAAGVNAVGALTAELFAPLGFAAEFVPSDNPSFGRHLFLSRPGTSGRVMLIASRTPSRMVTRTLKSLRTGSGSRGMAWKSSGGALTIPSGEFA